VHPEDPQALVAELVRTHGEPLRRFLTSRVRNLADVPDLVQEVFLRMLRLPNQDAIRSPEAYLFTVALHVTQQYAIRESSALQLQDPSALLAELHAPSDTDPELQTLADQRLEAFSRALEALTPKIRATFILHRRHGLTLEQIATELGISVPMAKKYLIRALFQFRHHLSDAG
jgi:RNA polymerase sigma factor (sigma-70 family)